MPAGTVAVLGVTVIDVRTGTMVTGVEPVMVLVPVPRCAVTVVTPPLMPLRRPLLAPMVAMLGWALAQVPEAVMSLVVLLLNLPIAWYGCVVPIPTFAFAGSTAIETSVGAMPLPVSGIDCEVGFALSENVSASERVPAAVSMNFTWILKYI